MGDPPEPHFVTRWRERGDPEYDPWAMMSVIKSAHQKDLAGQWVSWFSRVMDGDQPGTSIYRIRLNKVSYYVVIEDRSSTLITLLDQKMASKKKGKRRFLKRLRSRKGIAGRKARNE